jgi:phage terminase small subunit
MTASTTSLTPKQEAFCLAYIETGNASEAYRRAYDASRMKPETINRAAKKCLDNGKIGTRLQELRQPAIDAARVTLDSHLKRLARLSELAEAEGKFSAAVTAEIARGKAAGLYTEKMELTGKDGGPIKTAAAPVDLSQLSDDELEALEALLAKANTSEGDPAAD